MYLATVTFILHLWQVFLALHPWGYVIAALLALFALIKKKAIGAATSAAWKKCDIWFWGKIRAKLQPQQQTSQEGQTELRTYRGTFQDYVYRSLPPAGHTLTLSSSGFLVSVPVNFTHLLVGVKPGAYIEVDTEATIGLYGELVKRVRIDGTA
ncbi:MAG TPA: hypothetical protein VNX66_03945 [Candidatus Sulfotelmatobacter sp.]|jgi:hypothetical protein|nr:hypothetical protein [Candidatus Sulfotelmatobacter sp.]